jgi:hypothetical protein
LKQLLRHLVHLFEAIVAEDDLQLSVRVHERARHVVERNPELALQIGRMMIRHDHLGAKRRTEQRASTST